MLRKGQVVDKYEVVRSLGAGGMAEVFEVRHRILGSRHALKVLAPELRRKEVLRQRFLDEGRIQATLRHPHIVAVTDAVAEPEIAGLVMDFLEGMTLEARLERGPLEAAELRQVFAQLLAAIGFAHSENVIHRDLKPSNIMLTVGRGGDCRAYVLDFGIAKLFSGKGKLPTETGATMGTPHYMSPEQIQNAKGVTVRSDIFSLGATLYEAATGRPPFDGESEFSIQKKITEGRYEKPAVVNPAISL